MKGLRSGWLFFAAALAITAANLGCTSSGGNGGSGGDQGATGGVAGDGTLGQGGDAGSTAENGGNRAAGGADLPTGGTTGGGGSAAGLPGSGGRPDAGAPDAAPGLPPVLPVLSNGRYRFTWDAQVLEVDPALGGRVTVFSLDGKNVLTGPAAHPDNWGSTFWPSPQSVWNWPPPPEIEKLPYAASVDGDALLLVGQPSAAVGLKVNKRFRIDRATGHVELAFTLINTRAAAASWAPWQITRVAPGGLTFFALGSGGTIPSAQWKPVPLLSQGGVAWFNYEPQTNTEGLKSFADGMGWLAHAIPADRLLFVQVFPDVAAGGAAPAEAEIEIFVDAAKKYVELEPQGAYVALAPNQPRTWTVRWALRKLGAGDKIEIGSQTLLAAARAAGGI